MEEHLYAITEQDLPFYLDVIQERRTRAVRSRRGGGSDEEQLLTAPSRKLVGCLLYDLEDAAPGRAVLLKYVKPEEAQIIEISVVGWPRGNETIRVTVNDLNKEWPYTATAADVAQVLNVEESDVCLGTIEDQGAVRSLGRWRIRYPVDARISMRNTNVSASLEFGMRIRKTLFFERPNRVIRDVLCPLPLPEHTPLRAGSQVTLARYTNFLGIDGAEPRYLVSPYSAVYSS